MLEKNKLVKPINLIRLLPKRNENDRKFKREKSFYKIILPLFWKKIIE